MPGHICPQYVNKTNSQCTLTLMLDLRSNVSGGGGVLMIEDKKGPDYLEIETTFGMNTNVTTVIRYACSMSDDCAWEFINELFGPTLAEFDAISVQKKIIELLYTDKPASTGIQCISGICATNSYCQGTVEDIRTSQYRHINISNQLPCLSTVAGVNIVTVKQTFSFSDIVKTNLSLLCNRAECNNVSTLMQAYELFNNQYILPLNYSILNINTSFITTTPKSHASIINMSIQQREIIISIIISFLLWNRI